MCTEKQFLKNSHKFFIFEENCKPTHPRTSTKPKKKKKKTSNRTKKKTVHVKIQLLYTQ